MDRRNDTVSGLRYRSLRYFVIQLPPSGLARNSVVASIGDWMMYDLGLATQNLCLMAHSLGLGTVIVGLFDHDRAKEVIHTPDGIDLVAMIPVGYPEKVGNAPKRRERSEFAHNDRF